MTDKTNTGEIVADDNVKLILATANDVQKRCEQIGGAVVQKQADGSTDFELNQKTADALVEISGRLNDLVTEYEK